MTIGLIVEGKNDYLALELIIERILENSTIELKGAFKDGKSGIIHQKKALSNKLKNQGCEVILIIRDSDGGREQIICESIRQAYDNTEIRDIYDIALAVQEIEAWFLGDSVCLAEYYQLPVRARRACSGSPDTISDPKEYLKNYVSNESKGLEEYLESDSVGLAKLLNIDAVLKSSPSFKAFYEKVKTLAA